MKYAVEMGGMKGEGGFTDTQTRRRHGELISLISVFLKYGKFPKRKH
jgi:hypothetical protein